MSTLIYINENGITQKANSMVSKAEEYRSNIGNITKLTFSLCDVWNGNSHNKFVANYDSAIPAYEKIADAYDDAASAIKTYLKSMQDADFAAAKKIKNLF